MARTIGSTYYKRALMGEPDLKAYVDSIAERKGIKERAAERALALAMRQGDRLARAQLIEANLMMAVSIGRAYMGLGLPAMDIVAAGNVGLIIGADHYDPRKSRARFMTYVGPWVRAYIVRALRESDTISIPYDVWLARLRLGRVKEQGEALSQAEVMRLANVSPSELRRVEAIPAIVPYEAGEVEAVEDSANVTQAIEQQETRAFLERGIMLLPRRLQFIIRARSGLNAEGVTLSYNDIARFLGITASRVEQLEAQALHRLRDSLGPRLAQVG